jgi:hypothetical protein
MTDRKIPYIKLIYQNLGRLAPLIAATSAAVYRAILPDRSRVYFQPFRTCSAVAALGPPLTVVGQSARCPDDPAAEFNNL